MDLIKKDYETKSCKVNRKRAQNGQLKRNADNLPANIYKKNFQIPNGDVINGYFCTN